MRRAPVRSHRGGGGTSLDPASSCTLGKKTVPSLQIPSCLEAFVGLGNRGSLEAALTWNITQMHQARRRGYQRQRRTLHAD